LPEHLQNGDTAAVMNVILNGFQSKFCEEILQAAFAPFAVGYCLRIGMHWEHIPSIPAKELDFFFPDMKEDEREIDWNGIRPLDEKLIQKMCECETVFLHMMTRYEKTRFITYQERKRRYLRQLRYWNHVLLEKKISVYISNDVPHEGGDYIIFCLCKHLGIPTIILYEAGPIPDLLLVEDDWETSVPQVRERYEELLSEYPDGNAVPLAPKFDEYFQRQTQRGGEPEPWYLPRKSLRKDPALPTRALQRLRSSPGQFLRHVYMYTSLLLQKSYWQRQLFLWRRRHYESRMFAFYDAHVTEPDLAKNYLYVPLHMQPEASSCPNAGAYSDQQLVLQMLSSLLPPDVYLYVKEHPNQGAKGRDIQLYQDLLELPQVRLVPRNFSTFRLMQDCKAVVTGTGAVAFEAPFREKPVLMFGHDFEQYGPGVYPIHSVEDCQTALNAILRDGAHPTVGEARLFLRALQDIALEGYINPFYASVTKLTEEQNIRNVSVGLQKRLRALPH
jgi:hypothetical protein